MMKGAQVDMFEGLQLSQSGLNLDWHIAEL